MKKKMTKKQIRENEYTKQRKRIENYIKKAERQGWVISENILPKIPKTITDKSVERLKRIKAKEIQKKYIGFLTEDGEVVDVSTGKNIIKERKKKQPQPQPLPPQDEVAPTPVDIIDIIKAEINRIPSLKFFRVGGRHTRGGAIRVEMLDKKQELISLIDDNFNEFGDDYISHLKKEESRINHLTDVVVYGSEQEEVELTLIGLANLLNMNQPLSRTIKESLSELAEMYGYTQ